MDVGYGASSATSAAAAPSTPQASMPHRWPLRLFQTDDDLVSNDFLNSYLNPDPCII